MAQPGENGRWHESCLKSHLLLLFPDVWEKGKELFTSEVVQRGLRPQAVAEPDLVEENLKAILEFRPNGIRFYSWLFLNRPNW
jgi:hypothetical protein